MRYFFVSNDTVDTQSKVLVLGNFDGVHLGHQKLIQTAKQIDSDVTVLTFVNHPCELISKGEKQSYLLSLFQERVSLLFDQGTQSVAGYMFDECLMQMDKNQYCEWLIKHFPNIKAVVVGYNFRFSYGASSDANDLKVLLSGYNIETVVVDEFKLNDSESVSSSLIRGFIENGNITKANNLLGRRYFLSGKVVSGYSRGGKLLGFPTANVDVSQKKILPKGVFAGYTYVNGEKYISVANIGVNPTFNNDKISVEIHIIDFDRNIYGETIKFEFTDKIRSEMKFESITQLSEQINKDVEYARRTCFL